MSSKRVESRRAVIDRFVRHEEAHTRRAGVQGHHQLESKLIESTGQFHLVANGIVMATSGNQIIVDADGTEAPGRQIIVHRDTSVVGELVSAMKKQGFYKGLTSPTVDVWFRDGTA